jgi:hypothetical protein
VSWRHDPDPCPDDPHYILYGAKPHEDSSDLWQLIDDPVVFATSDDVVVGSTIEEIIDALDEERGGGGLVSWHEWPGRYDNGIIKVRSLPRLKKGDPFAAARAVEGIELSLDERLEPPEGATAIFDPEGSHLYARDVWQWEGFAFWQVSFREWRLSYNNENRLKKVKEDAKLIRRRLKSRERKAKRNAAYTTIPAVKARKAFSTARSLLEWSVGHHMGMGGLSIKVSYCYQLNKNTPRSRALELTHAVLSIWNSVRHEGVYFEDVRGIFQPLHDNWEVAKTKEDAEYVQPILDILWPDTHHNL